jgi:two-component system NtrC family sensor kinase
MSSLLNFARTEEPQREDTEVNALIDELLDDLEIPDSVDLVRGMDEELPVISVDPEQMRQVFRNLINNAAEAMLDGGQLTIESEAIRVEAPGSGEVRVAISDTGQGISEKNQERIFEPLFSTKTEMTSRCVTAVHFPL